MKQLRFDFPKKRNGPLIKTQLTEIKPPEERNVIINYDQMGRL